MWHCIYFPWNKIKYKTHGRAYSVLFLKLCLHNLFEKSLGFAWICNSSNIYLKCSKKTVWYIKSTRICNFDKRNQFAKKKTELKWSKINSLKHLFYFETFFSRRFISTRMQIEMSFHNFQPTFKMKTTLKTPISSYNLWIDLIYYTLRWTGSVHK